MAGILLEEYKEDEECPGRVTIKQDGTEEEEYSVEEILSKRKEGGVWKYHIKWYRWSHDYNTWEPASNLTHCQEKLDAFEKGWEGKKGSKRKLGKIPQRATGGEDDAAGTSQCGGQLDWVLGGVVKNQAKSVNAFEDTQEVKEFDKMWLGDHYSKFRRKWKSTEEPVCVVGSTVYNSVLLHMVRVRVESPEEEDNIAGTSMKTTGEAEENTVIVLSKMFGQLFPQILIAYYESRLMFLDEMKSLENLLKDVARAGLMHNLMGAKVNANYAKMFRDMMLQGDKSLDDNYEYFPKKQPEDEGEQEKKVEVFKSTRDRFGLPYYFGDEAEGIFGSEEECKSDDSDEWEEAGEGGAGGS